jgi:hypothetical protein
VTGEPTEHTLTNMDVIEAFLGTGQLDATASGDGRWTVEVEGVLADGRGPLRRYRGS